jgi:hypothetical protein
MADGGLEEALGAKRRATARLMHPTDGGLMTLILSMVGLGLRALRREKAYK